MVHRKISWNFATQRCKDMDPENFSLIQYCGAMEDLGIDFLHIPVEQVLHTLEAQAHLTVERIYSFGPPPHPEAPSPEQSLRYCLDMKKPSIGMGTPNGASYSMLRVTAYFIGLCYAFALDLKIRQLAHACQGAHDHGQKMYVLSLWRQLIDEVETYSLQCRKGGGYRGMGVASYRKRLEELLSTFKKI